MIVRQGKGYTIYIHLEYVQQCLDGIKKWNERRKMRSIYFFLSGEYKHS